MRSTLAQRDLASGMLDARADETEAALKAELGATFEATMRDANRAAIQIFGQDGAKALERAGFGAEKWFWDGVIAVAGMTREEGLPGGDSRGDGRLTPAQARSELNKMLEDPDVLAALDDRSSAKGRQFAADLARLETLANGLAA